MVLVHCEIQFGNVLGRTLAFMLMNEIDLEYSVLICDSTGFNIEVILPSGGKGVEKGKGAQIYGDGRKSDFGW